MPRQDQTTIKAPQSRQALDALIEQRNEMQGQLRSLEERRFELAGQVARMEATVGKEVQRRITTLDGSIDRLERQIATANEYITAGHARFGGEAGRAWTIQPPVPPMPAMPAMPAVPALPAEPSVPVIEVAPPPPSQSFPALERALILEGAGFLLLGAFLWVFAKRRLERRLGARAAGGDAVQMTQLQQSVDAIALEVERISENQRWVTKVLHEKALGVGEARPADMNAAEREPARRSS
jgi:hypothetical protein